MPIVDTSNLFTGNNFGLDANDKSRTKKNELTQEDFMRLFLTQLRSQSPLKPYDSSDMLQQMSQLTSLTATQELEKTIKNLNVNMGRSQMLAASQLIGKKVVMPSGVSQLTEKEGLNGSVVLPKAVSDVTIDIKDKSGKVIKTIRLAGSDAGVADFHWDGLDAEGKPVPPDFYDVSATATIDGKSFQIPTAGHFTVNSVAMDPTSGEVILNLDGIGGVPMGDIIKLL